MAVPGTVSSGTCRQGMGLGTALEGETGFMLRRVIQDRAFEWAWLEGWSRHKVERMALLMGTESGSERVWMKQKP